MVFYCVCVVPLVVICCHYRRLNRNFFCFIFYFSPSPFPPSSAYIHIFKRVGLPASLCTCEKHVKSLFFGVPSKNISIGKVFFFLLLFAFRMVLDKSEKKSTKIENTLKKTEMGKFVELMRLEKCDGILILSQFKQTYTQNEEDTTITWMCYFVYVCVCVCMTVEQQSSNWINCIYITVKSVCVYVHTTSNMASIRLENRDRE